MEDDSDDDKDWLQNGPSRKASFQIMLATQRQQFASSYGLNKNIVARFISVVCVCARALMLDCSLSLYQRTDTAGRWEDYWKLASEREKGVDGCDPTSKVELQITLPVIYY